MLACQIPKAGNEAEKRQISRFLVLDFLKRLNTRPNMDCHDRGRAITVGA
jgi:hypothetical protein